jgi:peptidyl-prolyl cis-trans isomerase C
MNVKAHKKILVGGVVATLSFLPACFNSIKKDSAPIAAENVSDRDSLPMTGEVLVRIKGVPAITSDSLKLEKERLFEANPQLKQAAAMIDSTELDRNLLEGLTHQKLIELYITSNKIDQTDEYKNTLRALCEERRQFLNLNYFSEKNPVTITETEIRNFYEANKNQALRISQGGVAATGIEFADDAGAKAFAARAKSSAGGFKKVANDEGLNAQIKDFKLVNDKSVGIDEQLRDSIAAIKTVPSIEIFEVNGAYWVINATAKEESKYMPYEQIRDRIKQQLEQEKNGEAYMSGIQKLKKEYDVQIDENYFKSPAAEQAMVENQQVNPTLSATQEKEERVA